MKHQLELFVSTCWICYFPWELFKRVIDPAIGIVYDLEKKQTHWRDLAEEYQIKVTPTLVSEGKGQFFKQSEIIEMIKSCSKYSSDYVNKVIEELRVNRGLIRSYHEPQAGEKYFEDIRDDPRYKNLLHDS